LDVFEGFSTIIHISPFGDIFLDFTPSPDPLGINGVDVLRVRANQTSSKMLPQSSRGSNSTKFVDSILFLEYLMLFERFPIGVDQSIKTGALTMT